MSRYKVGDRVMVKPSPDPNRIQRFIRDHILDKDRPIEAGMQGTVVGTDIAPDAQVLFDGQTEPGWVLDRHLEYGPAKR